MIAPPIELVAREVVPPHIRAKLPELECLESETGMSVFALKDRSRHEPEAGKTISMGPDQHSEDEALA